MGFISYYNVGWDLDPASESYETVIIVDFYVSVHSFMLDCMYAM